MRCLTFTQVYPKTLTSSIKIKSYNAEILARAKHMEHVQVLQKKYCAHFEMLSLQKVL